VGGGKPGKYLLGDWWVGEELEESQRFCLELALLVDEGRGTEEGARREEKEGLAGGFSCAVAQECLLPCPALPLGAGRLHQGESLSS